MRRIFGVFSTVGLVGVLIGAVVAVRPPRLITWNDVGGWLERTAPLEALTVLAWLGAVVLVGYVTLVTVGYFAAATLRLHGLLGTVRRFATPALRAALDGIVGVSALLSVTVGPATLAGAATPHVGAAAGSVDVYQPVVAGDETDPLYVPRPAGDQTEIAPTQTVVPPGDAVYDVQAGDHLWAIAERTLAAASGVAEPSISAAEVAPYWKQLVDANRERLLSGEPNLIYPGEQVVIPEP